MLKKVLLALLCGCMLLSLFACSDKPQQTSDENKINVLNCSSSEKGNEYNYRIFELENDKKSVVKFTASYGVNETYIKNNLKDFNSMDDAYNYYLKYYQTNYDNIMKGNENVRWLSCSLEYNPDEYFIQLLVEVDFSNEHFAPTDGTLYFLQQWFVMGDAYNKQTEKFEIDKNYIQTKITSGYDIIEYATK